MKNKLAIARDVCQNLSVEYGQYCPVARAVEIIGDRWTPLIIRELLAGVHRFNELERGLPGISRPILAERLRRLRHAGVIEHRLAPDGRTPGYYLTSGGLELRDVIEHLGNWGARWAFGDPRPDELDPILLLWRMRRRVNLAGLPPRPVVVRFEFRGVRRHRVLWLVLQRTEASLCLTDPGFDVDLLIKADIAAFYKVWLGRSPFSDALQDGLIEIDGASSLVRAFPRWLEWSPFRDAVRAATIQPPLEPKGRSA